MDSLRGPRRWSKEDRLLVGAPVVGAEGASSLPASSTNTGQTDSGNGSSNNSSSSRSRAREPALLAESEALFSSGPSADELRAARAGKVWRFYLWGQLANVVKAAVWWSSFGVLSVSMLGFPLAVGLLRAAFNSALVLLSPLASAAAESVSMRSLLLSTTAARWLVWGLGMPAAWLGLYVHLNRPDLFLWTALGLVFLDGVQVAFSNVVDVDCGGVDALSLQMDLPILGGLRDRFARLHHLTFNLSFIAFTPPVALLLLFVCPLLPAPLWLDALAGGRSCSLQLAEVGGPQSGFAESLCLLMGQGVVFGCLSLLSFCFYACGLPSKRRSSVSSWRAPPPDATSPLSPQEGGASLAADGAASAAGKDAAGGPPGRREWGGAGSVGRGAEGDSLCSDESLTDYSGASEAPPLLGETLLRLRDVKEGLFLVVGRRALAWRVLFLAIETALEDSVVSVLLPLLALFAPSLFSGRPPPADAAAAPVSILEANVWATCLISAGKVGGCLGSSLMQRLWGPPSLSPEGGPYATSEEEAEGRSGRRSSYRCLFWCVFGSSVSLLLLPLALLLRESWGAPRGVCVGLVFCSSLLFFGFSSAPKMGFATLLQSLVSSQQAACKVFGFVGAFVTVADACAILLVNGLFVFLLPRGPLAAVSAVCVLFLTHGLLEAFLGPVLVLEEEAAGDDFRGSSLGDSPRGEEAFPHAFECEPPRRPQTQQQLQAFLQRDASQVTTAATSG